MSSTQKKWLGMSGSGVVAGARRRGAPIVPTGEQESKLRLGLTVTRPSRESPVTPAGREMVSTSHQLMPIAPALVNLCGPRDQGQQGRPAGAQERWRAGERVSGAHLPRLVTNLPVSISTASRLVPSRLEWQSPVMLRTYIQDHASRSQLQNYLQQKRGPLSFAHGEIRSITASPLLRANI